jgi:Cyclic nucleotide-binding domain
LRAATTAHPDATQAAVRLAEVLTQHGHSAKAIEVLMGCARASAVARDDAPLLECLARLLDGAGNSEAAAKVRARLPQAARATQAAVVARPVGQVPSAPGAEGYGFLKALPMFADLSLEDMRSLFRICTSHAFAAGTHLIEVGQAGRGLFVIVEGQVEVFAGNTAEARMLNALGVGGYVGEISLLLDGPTSARVTARSNVKALFISREAFKQFVFSSPTAAVRIYRLFSVNLAERVRTLSAR